MSSTSTIVSSGSMSIGSWFRSPRYHYEYTYDSSVVSEKEKASTVILFVVGTNMTCNAYSDLASSWAFGQSTVVVVIDNNPWNGMKHSGTQTAEAFNDIVANITDRPWRRDSLGGITKSNPTIFVGGHSAGGQSVITALKENEGDLWFDFKPAGYIGLGVDLLSNNLIPRLLFGPSIPLPEKMWIAVPTLAIGFGGNPEQAGLTAYNITNENCVMMLVANPDNNCIFTNDGAWVSKNIGRFYHLFLNSIVEGEKTSKKDYECAVEDEHKSLVKVFCSAEDITGPPEAKEVKQGGRRRRKSQNNIGVTGPSRTVGPGRGGQKQGEGNDTDSDDGDWKPADNHPFINSLKYFFGHNCQSTIWNETDKVVTAIVTDRIIETVNTNAMSINLNPTIAGESPVSAGGNHTKKVVMGPTRPQVRPIQPGRKRRFNLVRSDYYLTYYTEDSATGRNAFHELNTLVQGKNDYRILPHYLTTRVNLSEEVDQRILSWVMR